MGTVREDQYTILIISRSALLRVRILEMKLNRTFNVQYRVSKIVPTKR
jgi:hypothetical protein